MEEKNLPRIGITTGTDKKSPKNPDLYIKAVEKAGGLPDFISPDMDVIELATFYDGLIIPGGKDIIPLFYHENRQFEIIPEEDKRIAFEISLLREIIKMRKPVLGICYGMQLINVVFRGTLYQDIYSQMNKSLDHSGGGHIIKVDDNPYYLKKGEFQVNSSHHQAVKDIGSGLKPFARARDSIIEAFYLRDYDFLLGVQWHPEREDNTMSGQIFRSFLNASVVHRKRVSRDDNR